MEAFGRKKTVTMGGAVIFVGTLLSSVAPVYTAQACARVLTGVGVGMIMSSVPVYIAEMAPANRRGTLQALFQVCVTLQILSGNVAGYYILGVSHRQPLEQYSCPLLRQFALLSPALHIGNMSLSLQDPIGTCSLATIVRSTPARTSFSRMPFCWHRGWFWLCVCALLEPLLCLSQRRGQATWLPKERRYFCTRGAWNVVRGPICFRFPFR